MSRFFRSKNSSHLEIGPMLQGKSFMLNVTAHLYFFLFVKLYLNIKLTRMWTESMRNENDLNRK